MVIEIGAGVTILGADRVRDPHRVGDTTTVTTSIRRWDVDFRIAGLTMCVKSVGGIIQW